MTRNHTTTHLRAKDSVDMPPAGLAESGGSSYIDSVLLRDRDTTANGTLACVDGVFVNCVSSLDVTRSSSIPGFRGSGVPDEAPRSEDGLRWHGQGSSGHLLEGLRCHPAAVHAALSNHDSASNHAQSPAPTPYNRCTLSPCRRAPCMLP